MINLLILLVAFSTPNENIQTEKYKLVGNRQYTYNNKGLRSQKISFDSENKLEKTVFYFYDENKNKIKTEKYLANDSLLAVYEYKFNKQNRKISSTKTDFLRNKKSSKHYFYNKLGQKIVAEYYSKGKLVKKVNYAYNKYGHQTEYLVYNSKDELKTAYYTENIYDEFGNLVQKYKRNKDTKLLKTNLYIYNNKSQISESLTVYHTGKRSNSKRVYTYDSQGRKIRFDKFISINDNK